MLPNLLIAGAQKGGTTWLHQMLWHHPCLFMTRPKEVGSSSDPTHHDDPAARAAYEQHFVRAGNARWRGESTPHYFWQRGDRAWSPPVRAIEPADFVAEVLGDSLERVLLLRDPVSRAVSAYHHNTPADGSWPVMGSSSAPPPWGWSTSASTRCTGRTGRTPSVRTCTSTTTWLLIPRSPREGGGPPGAACHAGDDGSRPPKPHHPRSAGSPGGAHPERAGRRAAPGDLRARDRVGRAPLPAWRDRDALVATLAEPA